MSLIPQGYLGAIFRKIHYDALRASTEMDENEGLHLTGLPGWKQIPCESEAGFPLVLSQARL